jgi:sulfur carrier protein
MKVVVNGTERDVPERATVAELVRGLASDGADGRGLAVAVEAEVVPRSEWEARELSAGERVEVVGAIQGG